MRILLTGGGTGGHIFPNIAIVEEASKDDKFLYIGEKGGIEEKIISGTKIPFRGIHCGKLRRYFSWKNLSDLIKIPIGILEALAIIKKFRPDVIFSKGGYVSVPVVIAGRLLAKKIITHDSDSLPGLATKINARFSRLICFAYEEAAGFFPKNKVQITGIPTRKVNLAGDKNRALKLTGFESSDPVVLILGGSLGADSINQIIFQALGELTARYQIVHITGQGKEQKLNLPEEIKNRYFQIPFTNQIGDFYDLADYAASRAGAGAIAELRSWGIPFILIPLGSDASHGDQIRNAEIHSARGECLTILPENFNKESLLGALKQLEKNNAQKNVQQNEKNISRNLSTFTLHRTAAKNILHLLKTV